MLPIKLPKLRHRHTLIRIFGVAKIKRVLKNRIGKTVRTSFILGRYWKEFENRLLGFAFMVKGHFI
jgi:hypothetical protein